MGKWFWYGFGVAWIIFLLSFLPMEGKMIISDTFAIGLGLFLVFPRIFKIDRSIICKGNRWIIVLAIEIIFLTLSAIFHHRARIGIVNNIYMIISLSLVGINILGFWFAVISRKKS
jgi:hypothetical protein